MSERWRNCARVYMSEESKRPAIPISCGCHQGTGWEFWGHSPAIVRAPGSWGICWPVPGPGRAVEGRRWACRAARGRLVQAVLQPQTEAGHLLLQLADGLAGVGCRQKQRSDAHEPNYGHPLLHLMYSLCPFLASTRSNAAVDSQTSPCVLFS